MSLTINHQTNDISASSGSMTIDGGGTGSPAGSVIYHAANTAPTGFLKANGAAVSRSTYAALFTAIGTTFGSGDGSSTFNVPDLRGEFPRGWDDSRGVDSGRSFGSAQADAFQGHEHFIGSSSGGGGSYNYAFVGTGPFGTQNLQTSNILNKSGFGTVRTASETRSRNIALLACIKY